MAGPAFQFLASPVDVTPSTRGSWVDCDVSGDVPAGASGAILRIKRSGLTGYTVGARKNGSTDTRTRGAQPADQDLQVIVGLDANRVMELYCTSGTSIAFTLVGYTDGACVTMLTNGVDKTPGVASTVLTDRKTIDCSSEAPDAIGLIFEQNGNTTSVCWWPHGAAQGDAAGTAGLGWNAIIGCDSSQRSDLYIDDVASSSVHLMGYVTKGAYFYDAKTRLQRSVSSWTALTALPAGAVAGFYDCSWTSGTCHLRKHPSGTPWETGVGNTFVVEADASGVVDGYCYVSRDILITGYSIETEDVLELPGIASAEAFGTFTLPSTLSLPSIYSDVVGPTTDPVKHIVELGLNLTNDGLFVLGTSTLDSGDVLGGFFSGYSWTDVTDYVTGITITRGRTDDLQTVLATQAQVDFEDLDERFNILNPSGPYYGYLRPMVPMRITMHAGGIAYRLFYGFVQSIDDAGWAVDGYQCSMSAADGLAMLEAVQPRYTSALISGSVKTAALGYVINEILDYSGWPRSMRSIPTGLDVYAPSPDGTKSGLALLQELLGEVGGILYVDGAGNAVYELESARAARMVDRFQLDDDMLSLSLPVEASDVINRVTWTYTPPGAQEATQSGVEQDAESQTKYGLRESSLAGQWVAQYQQLKERAEDIIAAHKAPYPRASVTLNDTVLEQLQAGLSLGLWDRVRLREAPATNATYQIEQITHALGGAGYDFSTTWTLTRRTAP